MLPLNHLSFYTLFKKNAAFVAFCSATEKGNRCAPKDFPPHQKARNPRQKNTIMLQTDNSAIARTILRFQQARDLYHPQLLHALATQAPKPLKRNTSIVVVAASSIDIGWPDSWPDQRIRLLCSHSLMKGAALRS